MNSRGDPDNISLFFFFQSDDRTGEKVNYSELAKNVAIYARALHDSGIQKGKNYTEIAWNHPALARIYSELARNADAWVTQSGLFAHLKTLLFSSNGFIYCGVPAPPCAS